MPSYTRLAITLVALRKESVDRNMGQVMHIHAEVPVALRKESVDRNPTIKAMRGDRKASLSARRAWIEIWHISHIPPSSPSLSARRAWIEINFPVTYHAVNVLSLSARRAWIEIAR